MRFRLGGIGEDSGVSRASSPVGGVLVSSLLTTVHHWYMLLFCIGVALECLGLPVNDRLGWVLALGSTLKRFAGVWL